MASDPQTATVVGMGIFDAGASVFTVYRARLAVRDRLVGGVPKDPKLIEGWLRGRAGLSGAEDIRAVLLRTLAELGAEVTADMTFEQLERASAALAAVRQTTGFKVGGRGLYVEARQVKALLKESTNVLFGGERWGATKKGPRSFMAERVFVSPDKLWLGVQEPGGVALMIGHVNGPRGPQSTLGYHEYVEQPTLQCEVMVVHDCLSSEQWAAIWQHAQENGLGAKRSQGFGRFDVVAWECATREAAPHHLEVPANGSRRAPGRSGAPETTTHPCPVLPGASLSTAPT